MSEEDNLGLHFAEPVEKEFMNLIVDYSNLPTRFGAQTELYIKLSSDVVVHNRSIYTSLDLLGDIGGL